MIEPIIFHKNLTESFDFLYKSSKISQEFNRPWTFKILYKCLNYQMGKQRQPEAANLRVNFISSSFLTESSRGPWYYVDTSALEIFGKSFAMRNFKKWY